MGIVTGLAAMNKQMETKTSSGDTQKGRWLQLKDGQSLKIRFMQEIDPDSKNYNEKAGLAFIELNIQIQKITSVKRFVQLKIKVDVLVASNIVVIRKLAGKGALVSMLMFWLMMVKKNPT